MARSRNIKPGFFANDELAETGPQGQILFAGLWCHADREGRLLDRPKRIKAEVFPYYPADVDSLLDALAARGFIERYRVGELACIQVNNFTKHQSPHLKEAQSEIPAPPAHASGPTPPPERHEFRPGVAPDTPGAGTGPAPGQHRADTMPAPDRHEASRPDSGLLIPDTGYQGSTGQGEAPKPAPRPRRPAPIRERTPEESAVLALLVQVPGFPPDVGDETTERLRDIAADFEGIDLLEVAKCLQLKGRGVKNGWLTFRNWVKQQASSEQERRHADHGPRGNQRPRHSAYAAERLGVGAAGSHGAGGQDSWDDPA